MVPKVVFIKASETAPKEPFFTSNREFIAESLGENPVIYERLCAVYSEKSLHLIKRLLDYAGLEFKIDP